ncbi:phage tail protein [Mucilaginibacter xinganensis]|uniref:Microcystin-dependent protein n=1 Tax=Mucilaginibacter xinganensis TaxID=1234841 RepID=A0A223NWN7_9SPHI|nr:tail fiber protein [Mucilaginibacter xinganensis]ASU34282.1 Microcystin-dependent protein [Mucilaginibacter xinganensis]
MNPSFIGAIYIFGGNFPIAGFSFCQGQLVAISENDTLYTLLGTTFGGDGVQTFGLPDLRGRMIVGQGQGPGLSQYVIGQRSGVENVTLTTNTMPSHTHLINANSGAGTTSTASTSSYMAAVVSGTTPENFYNTATPNATLAASTLSSAGSNIPFSIVQPVLAMNYVISLYGIYPSRN